MKVVKRDGQVKDFEDIKIFNAIKQASIASGIDMTNAEIAQIVEEVTETLNDEVLSVENIQDTVEEVLASHNFDVAKKYMIYRENRNLERYKRTAIKEVIDGVVNVEKNDTNNENANMNAYTPAGQMMILASEVSKDYAHKYLLNPEHSKLHRQGYIHIHDLDYYPTKTATCVQYDLKKLFNGGFKTEKGFIREPQSISSYATLAAIIFQTNQNEQHGGQAIPAFDYFLAPGILKSFRKHLADIIENISEFEYKEIKDFNFANVESIEVCEGIKSKLTAQFGITLDELNRAIEIATKKTRKEAFQALEGFLYNLNTMHSRGGNQVVFSSINYGTDTSPEGRMVTEEIMNATMSGLGKGEVFIFPIQIFKVKEGVNYSDQDYNNALQNWEQAEQGNLEFTTPNFDLFIKAAETTSKCLFPNYVFLDTPFNKHENWNPNDPDNYLNEVATMGCRTRVFENVRGNKTSVGRGNLSFTSINFPRLAIEAMQNAKDENAGLEGHEIQEIAVDKFLSSVEELANTVAQQLKYRYDYQVTALRKQFPFMMSNAIWTGGDSDGLQSEVGDTFAQGTLGLGFIGGHNAMVALYGEGHATNQDAYNTLFKAVEILNNVAQVYKEKYNLNYSALATPAEGLSGRFTFMDRKKFGEIAGVNDRNYYINSFHIDVKEDISAFDKIKAEAPFHAITGGGHITYVELDGEAKKNYQSVLAIVKTMKDNNIGYGSINHPIDVCRECGYKGIIHDTCCSCGSDNVSRIRRITGYLTGDLDSWNSFKRDEENDRVKHGF